jgi:Flp pilus assembly pilin Flp
MPERESTGFAAGSFRQTSPSNQSSDSMKQLLQRAWREDDGVLSFEWVLLATLLTIGIVAGIAAARDAIIDELGDVAEAAINIDQSYSLAAFSITIFPGEPNEATLEAAGSEFDDSPASFTDCARADAPAGQGSVPGP